MSRDGLASLVKRMRTLAKEHRGKVYGRRAATVARTVQDGLIDRKRSIVRPGDGCAAAFPKIRR